MFHVPAHKNPQPSQRPGQVPLPAPAQAPVQRTIGQRIADRKRATDLAVRDAIEYVRCCGYACERSPYPAHVFIYSYEYAHIDGVQQLVPKQHTVHHSKAIDFVNKLN